MMPLPILEKFLCELLEKSQLLWAKNNVMCTIQYSPV